MPAGFVSWDGPSGVPSQRPPVESYKMSLFVEV